MPREYELDDENPEPIELSAFAAFPSSKLLI